MKPTSDQIRYAMTKVETLFDNDFYEAISYHMEGPCYYLGWFDWCEEHRCWLEEQNLSLYKGETKVCIVDEELEDWVIKIGIRRKPSLEPKVGIDYMGLEAAYYEEAKKNNLGEFFAETYIIGRTHNVDIALQEFACPNEAKISDCFFDYVKNTYGYSPEDYEDEDEYFSMVTSAEEDMDTEERVQAIFGDNAAYKDLIAFIEEKEINDLHSGNWGITGNGEVVIFDFSGYYG